MLIQSETALNAEEKANYSKDQLEAIHQKEHKHARYFWIPEQVQHEDFSNKKEKNCGNIGKRPTIAPVLQCCSNCKIFGFYKTMDPTLHHKMKADKVQDGSGEGLQPR